MDEVMGKAVNGAGFLVEDLQFWFVKSSSAESIVLRDLIGRAALLEEDIKNLKFIMEEKE